MRLFLVRHGQTAWNAEFRAQGHTDIPLDETGLAQADQLASAMVDLGIAKVVSSDLVRAAKTAQRVAAALSVPLTLDHSLRERSFGSYEGMVFNKLSVTMAEQQRQDGVGPYDVCPPEGESVRDTWRRIEPFAHSLFREHENTLVVAHGASTALLLAHLVRGTVDTSRAFRFGNTSITELIRRPEGTFQILRYNDTSHLAEGKPLIGTLDGASR